MKEMDRERLRQGEDPRKHPGAGESIKASSGNHDSLENNALSSKETLSSGFLTVGFRNSPEAKTNTGPLFYNAKRRKSNYRA